MKKFKERYSLISNDDDLKSKAKEFDNFFRSFIKENASSKDKSSLLIFNYEEGFKSTKIKKISKFVKSIKK